MASLLPLSRHREPIGGPSVLVEAAPAAATGLPLTRLVTWWPSAGLRGPLILVGYPPPPPLLGLRRLQSNPANSSLQVLTPKGPLPKQSLFHCQNSVLCRAGVFRPRSCEKTFFTTDHTDFTDNTQNDRRFRGRVT